MHLPSRLVAALLQGPDESGPSRIVAKDILAMVTAIHDVADGLTPL